MLVKTMHSSMWDFAILKHNIWSILSMYQVSSEQ